MSDNKNDDDAINRVSALTELMDSQRNLFTPEAAARDREADAQAKIAALIKQSLGNDDERERVQLAAVKSLSQPSALRSVAAHSEPEWISALSNDPATAAAQMKAAAESAGEPGRKWYQDFLNALRAGVTP
jgi:hypothetical protein